jgi:hypothetical protein
MAGRAFDNAGTPVAAQVVESPHHAIRPPHDDSAFAQHVMAQPVAGIGNVADMAHDLPMGQEQLVTLQREHRVGMIGPAGQTAPVPVVRNGQAWIGKFGHVDVSISASSHW